MHFSGSPKIYYINVHTNCDDAQTDQSLFWSYSPQMNVSGEQNQSQKHCEARDVSNTDTSGQ